MRNSPFWFILIALMILLDFYVFQALKLVTQTSAPKTRSIIYIIYWVVAALAVITLIILPYINFDRFPPGFRSILFAVIIALFFSKLITAVFLLVDDIRRGIQWAAGKLFFSNTEGESMQEDNGISRSVFLTWVGFAFGGGLFASLIYGFSNKYDYQVKQVALSFKNLPAAFKGLRVVQISDIHSGSLANKAAVEIGVQKIMQLKPDLILFTGDLVNNTADEMNELADVFGRLQAPMGIYSILGNHDYGDYVKWESKIEKQQNLEKLKQIHAKMGWKLLLNQNDIINKAGEQIALIGVENWSNKARFPKYGDLARAYAGTETIPFKILLSHDPSHWEAQVLPKYADIDLMLSGHTHGMQFGVESPWLKWSPVQYVYDQWAGLYEKNDQKLYVNRGFGFLGYPGRVGILPEITLLQFS